MQDFKMDQDNYSQFDMVIDEENKVFDFVDGFETSISIQVFTDKRASGQDTSNPFNRRGWIGNLLSLDEGYEIGSLVWLKNQCRNTQTDKKEIEAYINSSFAHLLSIGAIKEISTEIIGDSFTVTIKISSDEIERYSNLWRLTNANTA